MKSADFITSLVEGREASQEEIPVNIISEENISEENIQEKAAQKEVVAPEIVKEDAPAVDVVTEGNAEIPPEESSPLDLSAIFNRL